MKNKLHMFIIAVLFVACIFSSGFLGVILWVLFTLSLFCSEQVRCWLDNSYMYLRLYIGGK